MVTRNKVLEKLSPYKGQYTILVKEQDTKDIISGILENHYIYCNEYDKIYSLFVGRNLKETANNVFNFLKSNVPYFIEPGDMQTLRSPSAIVANLNGADCKSYSLFANGVLDAYRRNEGKDFDVFYRFAGYNGDFIEHVFSAVCDCDKNKFFYIDPVLYNFDDRSVTPTVIKDKKIKKPMLVQVNGINRIAERRLQNYQSQFPPYTYVGNTYEAVGRMCGIDSMAGGMFDIGQDAAHLKDFSAGLEASYRSWLMLFVRPASPPIHSQLNRSIYFFLPDNIYYSLPKIVIDKFTAADHCFFKVNGQTDNAIGTGELFDLVQSAVTKKIGMTPKQFWAKFFGMQSVSGISNRYNGMSSQYNRIGTFDTSVLDDAALEVGLPPGVLETALNFFMPGLDLTPNPSTFEFKLSDFANTPYPKDKNLFSEITPQNPGSPPLVNTTPGTTTPGTTFNPLPANQGSMSPIIPIAAGVLLIMLLKK